MGTTDPGGKMPAVDKIYGLHRRDAGHQRRRWVDNAINDP